MGDSRQAMNWLDRAFDAGFEGPLSLINDTDFDPIRKDSAFQNYIDGAFEAAKMERRSPEHYPYRGTLEMLEKLRASGSTHGEKWHHVGSKLLAMREYDLAIEALTVAAANSGEKAANSMYNLACAQSLAGQERQALDWLDRSVDAGFDQHERFINDGDLDNVRGTAAFARIMDKSKFLSMERISKGGKDDPERSGDHLAPLIREYEDYVRTNPASGRGWFNLAYAQHLSGRYDDSAGNFAKAASLGFRASTATYNLACANSRLNNKNAALDALETAVGSGMFNYKQLQGDDDLDNLRDEPRFQALLDRLEKEFEHEEQKKIQEKMLKEEQLKIKKQAKQHKHDTGS